MDLPTELRENVYAQMFADLPHSIILRPDREKKECFPPIVPAICYTNKQIMNESIPAFLRGRQIHIRGGESGTILKRFLNQVPEEKAWKAITAIRFEHTFAPLVSHDLLEKCPSLRFIHAEFSNMHCFALDSANKTVSRKSISDLRDRWDHILTAPLLKLSSLRKLTMDCVDDFFLLLSRSHNRTWTGDIKCDSAVAFENFVALVRDERERWGAKCEIEFRHVGYTRRPYKMGWGSEDNN